jgi:RNA recognition motif-containing protein
MRSHTISVKGYPSDLLSERRLWEDFCRIGFVRQIEVRNNTGYIKFDTEEDAVRAFDELDEAKIEQRSIRIEVIEDRELNLPEVIIPLIALEKVERDVPPRPKDQPKRSKKKKKRVPEGRPLFDPNYERETVRDYAKPWNLDSEPKGRDYERPIF